MVIGVTKFIYENSYYFWKCDKKTQNVNVCIICLLKHLNQFLCIFFKTQKLISEWCVKML